MRHRQAREHRNLALPAACTIFAAMKPKITVFDKPRAETNSFGLCRGKKTCMNMNYEIMRIALPNIVSNITVPLMGIVSTAIAGHWGADSAATIGALAIGVSIFNFIYWNCSFVRMGTSGLTAQAYGAGNLRECTNMLARALVVAALMGAVMVALQWPVGELALWAMNGSAMTRDYFYARIWAVPAGILLFGLNGWFTGMQNAVIPMCTAIAVNVVHILCSLWFAFGFDMGIVGIAYASVLAQWCGVPPGVCSMGETCGDQLIVEHNGDVYSCDHFVYPAYRLGNIRETTLAEIYRSRRRFGFGLAKRNALPAECLRCPYYFACRGECPKHRFATGDDGCRKNLLCEGLYRYFRHAEPYMVRMRELLTHRQSPAGVMAFARERKGSNYK